MSTSTIEDSSKRDLGKSYIKNDSNEVGGSFATTEEGYRGNILNIANRDGEKAPFGNESTRKLKEDGRDAKTSIRQDLDIHWFLPADIFEHNNCLAWTAGPKSR